MAWPKGKPRYPHTGRKAGTPNKRTVEIEALFRRYHFNPIVRMIQMCNAPDEEVSREIKASLLKELAQYGWPKRKAIEHSGNIGVEGGILYLGEDITPEDLALASGRNGSV